MAILYRLLFKQANEKMGANLKISLRNLKIFWRFQFDSWRYIKIHIIGSMAQRFPCTSSSNWAKNSTR